MKGITVKFSKKVHFCPSGHYFTYLIGDFLP